MTGPELAEALCRFLHDGSAMLVGGASAYLAGLVPPALAAEVEGRLRRAGVVAIAVAVVTTVLALPIAAATLGDGLTDAVDPAAIEGVLSTSAIGTPWLLQAAAAIGLLAASFVPGRRRLGAIAIAAAVVLVTLAFTGHAVIQTGWIGIVHRLNDVVHLLAAAAWMGALVPLVLIIGRLLSRRHHRDARLALTRFSVAGHLLVPLILLSGVINTALVLGRWPIYWSSPYQALLAAKIAVVAAMIGLALANRYVFVPRLIAGRIPALQAIRRATLTEVALASAAVALVSVFGILDPV